MNWDKTHATAYVQPQPDGAGAKDAGVVIVGGGFAAVETALALRIAEGTVERPISIVSPRRSLSAGQDLTYAVFGTYPPEIALDDIVRRYSITWLTTTCTSIDAPRHVVRTADEQEIGYEHLILATGARVAPSHPVRLRTWSDARRVEPRIARILSGERATVMFSLVGDYAWPMPMIEIAQMFDLALRRHNTRGTCEIVIATEERHLLPRFGPDVGDIVADHVRSLGIEVLTAVPTGRIDQLDGSLTIEAGPLIANTVVGAPPSGSSGFLDPDPTGHIAHDIFAVGDLTAATYRTAGIVSAQARRIAERITGQPAELDPRLFVTQMFAETGSLHLALEPTDPFSRSTTCHVHVTQSTELPDHYAGTYSSQIGLIDSTRAAERFLSNIPPATHTHRRRGDPGAGSDDR